MAADSKDRMIRSAYQLFRERGYSGTGFREISAHSGVAKGAVYHHFPAGKADLAEQVIRLAGREVGDLMAAAADDVVLAPTPRLSAFAGTDLADRFADLGVCRVVLAGARTDIEIDSTARDAVELGLQTTVIADCCTGTTYAAHTATLEITLPRIVHGIVAVDDLLRRLPE